MELNELIMLGACSILGDKSSDQAIAAAVRVSARVWREVVKQEKNGTTYRILEEGK